MCLISELHGMGWLRPGIFGLVEPILRLVKGLGLSLVSCLVGSTCRVG